MTVRPDETATVVETPAGTLELQSGETASKALQPITVDAETMEVLNERVDNPAIPEHRRALKTEFGSATVEATPVVEVQDYGKLTVKHR